VLEAIKKPKGMGIIIMNNTKSNKDVISKESTDVKRLRNSNLYDLKIDDFRYSVSIYEYIKEFFPEFVLKKNGKNIKAFIPSKTEEKAKEEHILISRLQKGDQFYEVYFDVYDFDKTKPKSIIDLIGERVLKVQKLQGKDFFKAKLELKKYIDSNKFVHINNSSIDILTKHNAINQKKKNDNKPIIFNLPNKDTLEYLKSRNIKKEVLFSKDFIGTYGSYKDEENKIIDKPAFPLKKGKKLITVQWIDVKGPNERSKYFAADRNRNAALYKTNFPKKMNALVIIESPEKAMAHYQLFNKDMNGQKVYPGYVSSCGQLTKQDLEHIKDIIKERDLDLIIPAFDNDKQGDLYLGNTTLFLNEYSDYKLNKDLTSKNLLISFKDQEQSNRLMKKLNDLKVRYEYRKKEFKILSKDLVKIDSRIKNHQAISKDFLDDLKEGNRLPFKFKNPQNKQIGI